MIDCLVFGVRICDPDVARMLVGVNAGRVWRCLFGDEVMERLAVCFLPLAFDTEPNLACLAPFQCPEDHGLVVEVTASDVPPFAAYPSFIGFNCPPVCARLFGFIFTQAHSLADAMAKIPSRLVAYAQRALDLVSGHAFLGLAHQVNCKEPLPERQVSIVKDCLSRYAEMILASLERTAVLEASADLPGFSTAPKALNALWPADMLKRLAASVVRPEGRYQIDQIDVRFN